MSSQQQWFAECQIFIQEGFQEAFNAQSPAELMVACQSIHSALERVFRCYLSDVKGLASATDKKGTDFPTLLVLMSTHAPTIFTADTAATLRRYNSLRNRVAHEQFVPEKREVEDFAELAQRILVQLSATSQEVAPTAELATDLELWVCPICKTPNEPNRKYCKACGREKEQARREALGLTVCPACGQFENKKGERFCGGCGADIAKHESEDRAFNIACACIGAVAIIACLMGAFWGYQNWFSPVPTPYQTPTAAVVTVIIPAWTSPTPRGAAALTPTPTLIRECRVGIALTLRRDEGWLPPQKPSEGISIQVAHYVQQGKANGRPLSEMYHQVFGGPGCGSGSRGDYIPRHLTFHMVDKVQLSYGVTVANGEITCQEASVEGSIVGFGLVKSLDLRTLTESHPDEVVTCAGRRSQTSAALTRIRFSRLDRSSGGDLDASLLEMWYLFGDSFQDVQLPR